MTSINASASTPSHKTAGPDDPEFFAKILSRRFSDMPLGSDDRQAVLRNNPNPSTSTLPARLKSSHRIRRLLDILSHLAIFNLEQVAAVTARIEPNATGLDTHVYIAYNRDLESDMEAKVIKHIDDLIGQLKDIKAGASSDVRALGDEGVEAILNLCRTVDAFSSRILRSHLEKRSKVFEEMVQEVKKDGKAYFTAKELGELSDVVRFLRHILTTKDISKVSSYVAVTYQEWVDSGYMSIHRADDDDDEDDGDENEEESTLSSSALVLPPGVPLFQKVQIFMAECGVKFDMERWIAEIGSTYRRCLTLTWLRISNSFRVVFEGPIKVYIVPSLTPPYNSLSAPLDRSTLVSVMSAVRRDFSAQHVQLKRPKSGQTQSISINHSDCDRATDRFIDSLLPATDTTLDRVFVHCEMSMLFYVHSKKLPVYDYIGVSKLSCAMCDLYLKAFSEACGKRYCVRGSYRKFYPKWVFPESWPEGNGEEVQQQRDRIRKTLIGYLRDVLADQLVQVILKHFETPQSDSSAVSEASNHGAPPKMSKKFLEFEKGVDLEPPF